MWVFDAATLNFLEVNDAAVQHYGYSRAEFLAMGLRDIRPPGEVPQLLATLAEVNHPATIECRHRLKSGAVIDTQVTSHTLSFAGRPSVVITAQDVTVRTRAEAALAERAALTTVSAEVGAALNRTCDLRDGMQSCAEAIVAHLNVAAVRITLAPFDRGGRELTAAAGEPIVQATGRALDADWPLTVGDRVVGRLTVSAGAALSDGTVAGLTSVAAMIALGVTRRQAEDARRRLAEVVASSDEAIYGTTADGTVVTWNAGAERLFGYRGDAIIGRPIEILYPPERRADLPLLMARINRGESVMHLETVRLRRDGSTVPVSLSLSPIRDAAGQVMGTSAVARDVTGRQATEARLRLLAHALESTNEMVSVTDVEDRFTFVNAAFLRAYGYAESEVIGQRPALLQSDQTPEVILGEILRDSRGGGWAGELLNRRKDGTEFFISLNTSTVRGDHGEIIGLLGVARDITDRRSLESQLRQSQKMDAVGQLAGGIAHDFNNLLTVIQGCAGFLAEAMPSGDESQADVDEIRRAAERAAGLTRQLLAFSRKQILAVRVLHVGDVVGEVTPMLRRLIGETIDLRTAVGNRGLVKTDPGQLQQVIVNLAVNARDAMPRGGRLTVETSDVTVDEAFARLHPSMQPGRHVVLAVIDTGHGMDAATQKRIFEPFFTTKPVGQGTGLGLATVYGIVKQSGGSIWVDSAVGAGTTFTVYLPTTDELADDGVAAPRPPPGGTETVLVIEDEGPVREFVYKVLSRRGYAVHAVADPRKALDYARAAGAPIDLIFSDVNLPNMSGLAAVTQIQEWHPESAVLFMSGFTDRAIVHEGVLDAGTLFLHKPFTADALTRKVRDVLDTSARLTAARADDRASGTTSGG
jgi:two-component system cell cycle sensor histidine kinase/response regulator CckA